jgi:hypothetical protein
MHLKNWSWKDAKNPSLASKELTVIPPTNLVDIVEGIDDGVGEVVALSQGKPG